ncbi:serine hydrolase [Brachybacterium alimentarium]|uniref:serine hydrolase n=2 Tax=Brachybacterium TaxID=43668 RepID=UPI000BB89AF5|nr:serine hydrolase [Brachybacterium alimentarium]PCC34328.1 serine hydrolase [Brachybacterium alimentarium]RCS65978.1 serine hydrolase [Brachybacterium alimentarium]RCS75830.1 serine hydrolase [Brachybacterium alimentarium]RCS76326.1 serine hydrolase [Brachybacterium alimentarium]RCS92526.1 serine hydrolase [Brachybacterium alimentarium]
MSIPTAAAPDRVSVSFCLIDRAGGVLAAEGADRPYYAASTIKLHVLLTALRAADGGALDLEATVPATRTFTCCDGTRFTLGGDHLDPTHPADGAAISVRDLLRRMIDRSSNEATNHLVELIGIDAVDETIQRLELGATRVERLIGDAAALEAGRTNETSADDLARTMLALVRRDEATAGPDAHRARHPATLPAQSRQSAQPRRSTQARHSAWDPRAAQSPQPSLSIASVELARAALRAQQIPLITTAVREDVDHGSKSGWVDGYRHDVAFLGDPDGEELHVLAAMTSGLQPQEADARIAQLVRDLLPAATA